ncbi:MAG TPA: hypothetical protein VGF04_06215 [Solirubrobacterales bacterium]|jgi:hypothetical protein
MDEAILLPLAHAGHWLWVLYLPPVLIVVGSIIRAKLAERRRRRSDTDRSTD